MLRGRKQRRPGEVAQGAGVVVQIAIPDGRDRSPEVERVLGLPARDAGIGGREVDQRQGASGRRQVKTARLYHLARHPVPDRCRRGQPEPGDLSLLVSPGLAGQRPDLLHLVVVAGIAAAVKEGRTIGFEL